MGDFPWLARFCKPCLSILSTVHRTVPTKFFYVILSSQDFTSRLFGLQNILFQKRRYISKIIVPLLPTYIHIFLGQKLNHFLYKINGNAPMVVERKQSTIHSPCVCVYVTPTGAFFFYHNSFKYDIRKE